MNLKPSTVEELKCFVKACVLKKKKTGKDRKTPSYDARLDW